MKAGWAADELGGAGDEVKGGYDLEDRKIMEVSLFDNSLSSVLFMCLAVYIFV